MPCQPPDRGDSSGFTLVELLVSLLLFALISLAGAGLIETVIGVQERTAARGERLAEIQRATYLIAADIEQLVAGPLIEPGSLSFVRSGAAGDFAVTYRFSDGALYRKAGASDLPVLGAVSGLTLQYWKNGAWTGTPTTPDDLARPQAIEMRFELARLPNRTGGTVRRVIELPDAP